MYNNSRKKCNYTMRVRGSRKNVLEMLDILKCTHADKLRFDCSVMDFTNADEISKWNGNIGAEFFGECDVSVDKSMLNNLNSSTDCSQEDLYNLNNKGCLGTLTNIVDESMRLSLDIEIRSLNYATFIEEYIYITKGYIKKNEKHDFYVYTDKEGIEQGDPSKHWEFNIESNNVDK